MKKKERGKTTGGVGSNKFLHLKKILKKDLAKILEDFLSYNNL